MIIPDQNRGDQPSVDLFAGLNAIIGASMNPPRSAEWVAEDYFRRKELRETRRVRHYSDEGDPIRLPPRISAQRNIVCEQLKWCKEHIADLSARVSALESNPAKTTPARAEADADAIVRRLGKQQ